MKCSTLHQTATSDGQLFLILLTYQILSNESGFVIMRV